MAEVRGKNVHFSYETAGDGFPLVLVPGLQEIWGPYIPLLSELCRTIMYSGSALADSPSGEERYPGARAVERLGTFLELLGLERVYLASQAVSWPMALRFALHSPKRLEGLVLIGEHEVATDIVDGLMSLETHLHAIPTPTLVLSEAETLASYADLLTERLPHCTRLVVSDALPAASSDIPALRLGHAVMRFLLHCERQRNLVRGASFLL
jgi:pimeloyl-ACP methyl ester carboxylesterase